MEWKPNKLIAILLGFFLQPFGMLYINRPILAAFYLGLGVAAGVCDLIFAQGILADYPYLSFMLFYMSLCALHTLFLLLFSKPIPVRAWYSRWYGLLSLLAVLLLSIFILRAFAYEPFKISSRAMSPTLNPGNTLIAAKWGYGNYGTYGLDIAGKQLSTTLHRGAIVVFQYPKDPKIKFVKRIIGLPGDKIEYKKDSLTINGKILPRRFLSTNGTDDSYVEHLDDVEYTIYSTPARPSIEAMVIVPKNHIFVMGDNRDNSNDSRYWGFVPYHYIVGGMAYVF